MGDLERLKNLDPQEVFKKTYIAPKVLKALAEGHFDQLGNRARALGFVTILERELGLDLAELREQIDKHFGPQSTAQSLQEAEKAPATGGPKRGASPLLAVLGAALVLGGLALLGWHFLADSKKSAPKVSQDAFFQGDAPAAKPQESAASDRNESAAKSEVAKESEEEKEALEVAAEPQASEEQNASELFESEEPPPKPTLAILPSRKLWIGIIYLDNREKKAYVTSRPIEINTSRDQLIVTGHGLLSIDEDGELKEYKERRKLYFIYRAGKLEPIDAATFRRYNRGKSW